MFGKLDAANAYRDEQVLHGHKDARILEFWQSYEWMRPETRSYYEVISRGLSSKLYFDIEYSFKEYSNHNGEALVDAFIDFLRQDVQQTFQVRIERSNLIELDSSTATKFSKHIIIPNLVFRDNLQVGYYVLYLLNRIRHNVTDRGTASALHQLLPPNDKGTCFFIDTAVYTKNRLFRLYLSSKRGKQAFLVPSVSHLHYGAVQSDRDIFYASLITHVDEGIVPVVFQPNAGPVLSQELQPAPRINSYQTHSMMSASPLAALDQYMNSFIKSISRDAGFIRSVRYSPLQNRVVYAIGGTRFCGNVQREHKSNHIFYTVDLDAQSMVQKCTDRDCSHYTSPPLPLPSRLFDQH